MEIPDFGPFAKGLRGLDDKELGYLKQVLDSGKLSLFANDGGLTRRFEKAFAQYTGAPAVAGARSSGMSGLIEAIAVSGAGVGTEVLCDSVVHFGALTATYFNSVPRFVDIEPDTYNMDPDSLRANITPNAKAVIVTHMWGLSARIEEIRDICKEHNLFLIEDCAHAVGTKWNGRHVGTFGDVGVFSFQEFKQLSTGDGGMNLINDAALADKLDNAWAFSGESPVIMTLNGRMTEMAAAVGLAQLERIDGILEHYNTTLGILNDAIADCDWLKNRHVPEQATQSGYWFACKWEGEKHGLDYERFKQIDEQLGIGLRFGFNQTAPYEFEFFRDAKAYGHGCPIKCPRFTERSDYVYKKGLCPVVEDVMPRLITVNLIFLSLDEAKQMADKIRKAIEMTEQG